MLLNPDPVAHAKALLAKGRGHEALDYITGISNSLTESLKEIGFTRLKILAALFESAAKRDDLAEATAHYHALQAFYKNSTLADTAVETRYLRATYAAKTRPVPIDRKFRHMKLVELLRSVFELEGDIAECGCFRGLSSWMICETLNEENGGFDGTGFHIFDSFAGLSDPVAEDQLTVETEDGERLGDMMQPGMFACSEVDVRRNLAAFFAITYHPGWLPQSLEGQPERRYRFLHIDVDLYAPTLGALDYFYPRMVSGGLIVTDDYGWPGARKAFDQFCARHDLQLEVLAGNQAVLRK